MLIGHQIEMTVDGRKVRTLADILPAHSPIRILIVGKTPLPDSVNAGHYFQGSQGKLLWSQLKEYGLLRVPLGVHEDDVLVQHSYGITDVVKLPHRARHEPSDAEYGRGIPRVLDLIQRLRPRVILFVYKKPLDKLLTLHFGCKTKSGYGFNPGLSPKFQSKVFACPLPGVGGRSSEEIASAMRDLRGEVVARG